jgi:hypothetical protein
MVAVFIFRTKTNDTTGCGVVLRFLSSPGNRRQVEIRVDEALLSERIKHRCEKTFNGSKERLKLLFYEKTPFDRLLGSGTNQQDMVDCEEQSILKMRSLS